MKTRDKNMTESSCNNISVGIKIKYMTYKIKIKKKFWEMSVWVKHTLLWKRNLVLFLAPTDKANSGSGPVEHWGCRQEYSETWSIYLAATLVKWMITRFPWGTLTQKVSWYSIETDTWCQLPVFTNTYRWLSTHAHTTNV